MDDSSLADRRVQTNQPIILNYKWNDFADFHSSSIVLSLKIPEKCTSSFLAATSKTAEK